MVDARELDSCLTRVFERVQLLPAIIPSNLVAERKRLTELVHHRKMCRPRWRYAKSLSFKSIRPAFNHARSIAHVSPFAVHYHKRLDELEREMAMITCVGDARRMRVLARQVFTPLINFQIVQKKTARLLKQTLSSISLSTEDLSKTLDQEKIHALMKSFARACGLSVDIVFDAHLMADAAAGEHTLYLRAQPLEFKHAMRLAIHEIGAHLVVASNARRQHVGLLAIGTARSFIDQEGLALCLEEQYGALDIKRLRVILARAWASAALDDGANFNDVIYTLVDLFYFSAQEAVGISERTFRGGGTYRDLAYLVGWLRVRKACARQRLVLEQLSGARIGVDDLPLIKLMQREGLLRAPIYRLSFARKRLATLSGVSLEISAPKIAASLIKLELT